MKRIAILAVLPQLGLAAPAHAKPLAPVTTVEGVSEYDLDNGLRVLLFPDDSQPKVTVAVTYLVGSRHEGYGETGMAHLLEHMLFKGTPRHPDFDIELKPTGARYNASTDYDRTLYFETLPASDENLALALALEADRMTNAKIAAADLAKEFTVVRNELEMRENSPENVLHERVLATMYLWHNYGKAPIGSRADIERVPADSLRRFYVKYYQPDDAVLIVAGKFDRDKTLALIQKDFAVIPRPARKLEPTYTVEPVQDGEREVSLRRSGDVQVVDIAYHIPSAADERFPAFTALGFVLADKPNGRLYKALVETGMATSVDADAALLADPGYFEITAEIPSGKPFEPVRDKILQIVEGLAKSPPTEEEVARFRVHQAKNMELTLANSERTAHILGSLSAVGDWRLVFLGRDRYEKVTAAAATAAATTFFKSSNRTIGVFYPTKDADRVPLPPPVDVAGLVKDYKGHVAVTQGEAFEASTPNIEKRTTRKALPVGLKLALLPKQTRGDVVMAQLSLHFGTEKDLTGHDEAAALVGALLMRGSKHHTYQQIKDELDRLKANVSIGSDGGDATVGIRTKRENLVEVVGLVAEILREPAFPADQLEVLRKERLAGVEQSRSDPRAQGRIALERRIYPYPKTDIRYVPTTDETLARLKAVTLDEVKGIYAMWGLGRAEMTVVGAFDPDAVVAALDKGLGSWKSPKPYERIADPFKAVPGAAETVDTPDKENAVLLTSLPLELRDDDADYPALRLAAYVLGSGNPSRLWDRLREKEGWSYAVAAGLSASSLDRRGRLDIFAIVAPQNAAKALAAIVEELDRLLDKGVNADELARAKKAYRSQFSNGLANDETVVSLLNRDLYLDRTLAFQQKIVDAVDALGPGDIAAVLAKGYVKSAGLVRVTAGDMKKAQAATAK